MTLSLLLLVLACLLALVAAFGVRSVRGVDLFILSFALYVLSLLLPL